MKTIKKNFYEIIMAVLALMVLGILIVEFTYPLTEEQKQFITNLDLGILSIFAVDYFYRFYRAKQKMVFFKSNIFDLIAIIPFDKAFRIARLARLTRLVRLSRTTRVIRTLRILRLIRVIIISRKLFYNFKAVLKTNGLNYVLIFCVLLVFFGGFGIFLVEDKVESFQDALWWSLVTTTTVGYGDISPDSLGGRLIASVLMLVGIGLMGMVTGSVATYFVGNLQKNKEKEDSFCSEQIQLIKNKIDELENLTREDIKTINDLLFHIWEQKQTKNSL